MQENNFECSTCGSKQRTDSCVVRLTVEGTGAPMFVYGTYRGDRGVATSHNMGAELSYELCTLFSNHTDCRHARRLAGGPMYCHGKVVSSLSSPNPTWRICHPLGVTVVYPFLFNHLRRGYGRFNDIGFVHCRGVSTPRSAVECSRGSEGRSASEVAAPVASGKRGRSCGVPPTASSRGLGRLYDLDDVTLLVTLSFIDARTLTQVKVEPPRK